MKKAAAFSAALILTAGILIGYNEWHDRATDSRTALDLYYAEPESLTERIDLFQLRMHDRMIELDEEFEQLERDAEIQHTFDEETYATRLLHERFDHLEAGIGIARWEGLLELELATDQDWPILRQRKVDLAVELEQELRALRRSIFPTGVATLGDQNEVYFAEMEAMGIPIK